MEGTFKGLIQITTNKVQWLYRRHDECPPERVFRVKPWEGSFASKNCYILYWRDDNSAPKDYVGNPWVISREELIRLFDEGNINIIERYK